MPEQGAQEKRGLLLVAHGSVVPGAELDLLALAERLRETGQEADRTQGSDVATESVEGALVGASDVYEIVEVGFLSGTSPSLAEAVHSCAAKGVTELVVMPYFLTAGFLARKAVQVVEREAQNYAGLHLFVAAPLGPHPKLLDVVLDRIEEAAREAD